MSENAKIDLKSLRDLLGLPEEVELEPTQFAQSVAAVLTRAVVSLREQGVLEVEAANVEALANEVTTAVLESSSLKRLPLRLVKTLIHSDFVDEVYGTDEEISAALRPFLDAL